eukprot:s2546_g7.t1
MGQAAEAPEPAQPAPNPAMSLPVDWDPSMMADDIETLRREYKTQVENSLPSPRLQFNYAKALVSSSRYADIEEGIFLLNELFDVGFHRPDCLHTLALAYLKVGNYAQAKEKLDIWIHLEPQNCPG